MPKLAELVRDAWGSPRHISHRADDRVGMVRLLQTSAARYRTGRNRRVSRRVDHGQVGIVLAAALRDLPSIDAAQPDIRDEKVRLVPSALGERLFAVLRLDNLDFVPAQRLDDEFPDKFIVLDDKYAHRRYLKYLIYVRNQERPATWDVPAPISPGTQGKCRQPVDLLAGRGAVPQLLNPSGEQWRRPAALTHVAPAAYGLLWIPSRRVPRQDALVRA